MLKRLCIVTAILTVSLGSVQAAGTIPFSLSQQFDEHGKPLSGCKFYTIQAGTVATPQNAYQDEALTIALPNPITCDAAGRLPQFFLADGSIKVRLTDKNGVQQIVADGILVIGPSGGGGGGGGGVDPTTVFQTGDVMWSETSGSRTGWVRDNGRTIGSATSGATERANSDTESLFNWLWQNCDDGRCPVIGGRGASSAADWTANKQITLPDKRGYIVGGLDDMGNSAAGRFAGVPVVSGGVTTAGSVVGEALHTLSADELPSHDHSVYLSDPGHVHDFTTAVSTFGVQAGGSTILAGSGTRTTFEALTGLTIWSQSGGAGNQNKTAASGGGAAHSVVQKTVLGTFYRKL